MTCGWIGMDKTFLLAGAPGKINIPVPVYLIDHPKGRVLFDTGIHPHTQTDVAGRIGDLANDFEVTFRPGEEVAARLETLQIDAGDVEFIINSHLHWDHPGGNETVPNAKVVIQQREWEAGHLPEKMESNSFNPKDYDLGHQMMLIDGEHDLFGDGSIVTVPTYGHTPGHQSLRVRLDSGDFVLTADACYFKETLENLALPEILDDPEQMMESLKLLRRLQSAGARIFYGHDPEFWESVPQAPLEIT
jgi:glyoxylase-like metal-dependent hydrolase (beta-lactamase superfamily II)